LVWSQISEIMSVSATFNKSKTNQLICFLLEKYDKMEDYAIIKHALQEQWIKTSNPKEKDPAAPKEPKDKGQSKWTAYQKWAKKKVEYEERRRQMAQRLDRATMKQIYTAYDDDQLKEWQRVAEELNSGKNIIDIENKPEIKMPNPAPEPPAEE